MKKKKKIVYTEGPSDTLGEIVPNFLPPPEAFKNAKTRVTVRINISKKSFELLKAKARKAKKPYIEFIREILNVETGVPIDR